MSALVAQLFINEETFFATYRPKTNPFHPHAAYEGTMLGFSDEELRLLRETLGTSPDCVWTVVESDGIQAITSGVHSVNRLGFIITEVPGPHHVMIDALADDDLKAILQ